MTKQWGGLGGRRGGRGKEERAFWERVGFDGWGFCAF